MEKIYIRKNKKKGITTIIIWGTNKQDGLCSICMLFTHTWKDEGNPGNAPTIFYCVWMIGINNNKNK